VGGSCEYGDEPAGSGAMYFYIYITYTHIAEFKMDRDCVSLRAHAVKE
jgi:hypothetical protein